MSDTDPDSDPSLVELALAAIDINVSLVLKVTALGLQGAFSRALSPQDHVRMTALSDQATRLDNIVHDANPSLEEDYSLEDYLRDMDHLDSLYIARIAYVDLQTQMVRRVMDDDQMSGVVPERNRTLRLSRAFHAVQAYSLAELHRPLRPFEPELPVVIGPPPPPPSFH